MGPVVSKKKLEKEEKWETRKEILGWLIDGVRRTIELPPNKSETLCSEITLAIDYARNSPKKHIPLKQFQKIHGRLQFVSMAMVVSKPLLEPLDRGLATTEAKNGEIVILTESIYVSLKEGLHIIKLIGAKPVKCKRLVLHPAAYQGFVNASHWGVGGVWFGRSKSLPPIVWFLEWPSHLKQHFLTNKTCQAPLTFRNSN